MSDQKAKVKSYVRRRLESWQHEPNPHQIRAIWQICAAASEKRPETCRSSGGCCFGTFRRN